MRISNRTATTRLAFLALFAAQFARTTAPAQDTPTPTPVQVPPCNYVLYAQDFELGSEWAIDNTSDLVGGPGNGLWHVSDSCATLLPGHSGAAALGYHNDACDYFVDLGEGLVANNGTVLSPSIPLPEGTAPITLTLNYYLQTVGPFLTAGGVIYVLADGTPTGIASSTGVGTWLEEGGPSWRTLVADVTGFAGQMIQIGVLFRTAGALDNDGAGFFIDDVTVLLGQDCTPTPTPSPTPPDPRESGDFDNSGCTDLADFLFLLDYWLLESSPGSPAYDINGFLSLLDNWGMGPTCG